MTAVQPYFRDAVDGDVHAITTIMRGVAPHDPAHQQATPETYRRLLDEIDHLDGCYLLVGEYAGELGAVLQLVVFPTLIGVGRTAELVGPWVAERYRTSGMAGMLLDHALARADDLGCVRIQVMANSAHRAERSFWERAGFVHADAGYVRDRSSTRRVRQVG
jgi:GNAT superfamily N-acetyltransferase